MKKLLLLLVFPFLASSASFAQDNGRKPRAKANRAFGHSAEASKKRNSKARFRPENNVKPIFDMNPRKPGSFKTSKAPKDYKFSDGAGFKPVK